jgi:hypothetical protein
MDPEACLEELLAAWRNNDKDAASVHARELREWLGVGGFSPRAFVGESCFTARGELRRAEREGRPTLWLAHLLQADYP